MEPYGPPDATELPTLADVLARSFAFPATDARRWLEGAGLEHTRVWRVDGLVVGGCLLLPLRQWWGGRSVPTLGVAGVGVAPEHRGRGHATRLMHRVVRDARDSGHPLSLLYPLTWGVYRRAGWEIAGGRYEIRLDARAIRVADRELPLRRLHPTDDVEALRDRTRELGRFTNGRLERNAFLWDRVFRMNGVDAEGYAVGELDAWVWFVRESKDRGTFDLHVTDMAAATPGAARRLLTLFADHGTLCDRVIWRGSADDVLVSLLPERTYTTRLVEHWMLRVCDVAGALEQRGWPPDVTARVDLDVHDDTIADNHGRFVLEVEAGAARVRRGGDGAVRVTARGLAALYTGHRSVLQLTAGGQVAGDERALARAVALFATAPPALADGF